MNSTSQQPIRGPEWSGAQVTRTSLRVEPMSKAQQRQLLHESLRSRADEKRQQIQKFVVDVLMPPTPIATTPPDSSRSGNMKRARSVKAWKVTRNSNDFREFKKELSKSGVCTSNGAFLHPVVDEHQSAHRLMRSWNAKTA
jgi:Zn-dependent M32 family carboxypeptidase